MSGLGTGVESVNASLAASPGTAGHNSGGGSGLGSSGSTGVPLDPVAQISTYKSYVSLLVDPSAKDESKQKAAQELSEDFETITTSPAYPSFLAHSMPLFVRVLQEGEAQFIAEHSMQITRKLVLEILHRLPTNDHLRPYVKPVLSVMFKLLEVENEDNVLVCLRVIIELHKQYRPQFNPEIQNFLNFVKNIYRELPNQLEKIFEPRDGSIKVRDISEVSMDTLLNETFTMTTVQVGSGEVTAPVASVTIIPKAILSLKVLAELPIIVVLMYQLYKQNVHRDVAEFIPLILNTIVLRPSVEQQEHKDFNREVFVDFLAAQIKTLSFLAYIVKIYQDVVGANVNQLADGMIGLLMRCPPEVAHLRKELLIAARHILATELRTKFVVYIDKLFDEDILLGNGWTANESLRPLAYSTLADLVHHVRQSLTLKQLSAAVSMFSKNVHDETLPVSMQTMSCKLLLNLVDCIRTKSQLSTLENPSGSAATAAGVGVADASGGGSNSSITGSGECGSSNAVMGRELLTRMLEVFVRKFCTISQVQLPALIRASKIYSDESAAAAAAAAAVASASTVKGGTLGVGTASSATASVSASGVTQQSSATAVTAASGPAATGLGSSSSSLPTASENNSLSSSQSSTGATTLTKGHTSAASGVGTAPPTASASSATIGSSAVSALTNRHVAPTTPVNAANSAVVARGAASPSSNAFGAQAGGTDSGTSATQHGSAPPSQQQQQTTGGNASTVSPATVLLPQAQTQFTVVDCRTLMKTLVCGVKTITWGIGTCRVQLSTASAAGSASAAGPVMGVTAVSGSAAVSGTSSAGGSMAGSGSSSDEQQFTASETLMFIRLVRHAMLSLDIYTLPLAVSTAGSVLGAASSNAAASGVGPVAGGGTAAAQNPQSTHLAHAAALRAAQIAAAAAAALPQKSKEEKEVLDHFGGTFTMMPPGMFRAIFSTTIDYVVERLNKNPLLQTVANCFLANKTTSSIFATICVEYLLERMEDMGSNVEKSGLYLKLFKLVFGSVSLFPQENEQMLKPHLHKIVNRSMQLALSAKEPYNYFLLLRALFRSIGGGSHDLLYQEFLPLLPTLLQGLNQLQSGLHKQHMKDLFVELCLTVPVRLSSLLPYLPMLMDPLVSALNGSQTLISQGLRTLELCVDNLQPDFLYEHIQPVRAELMQALWKTLRNPQDNIAQIAFRVLGKFGGGNRKMLVEPQFLKYNEHSTEGPAIMVPFLEHRRPVWLPLGRLIEAAVDALKSSATDPFYRQRCWDLIKGYLLSHMQPLDSSVSVLSLLSDPAFATGPIAPYNLGYHVCQSVPHRNTHKMALTAMFVAAAIKELRGQVLPFLVSVVNHYTMVAVSQQAGPFVAAYKQSLHSNKLSTNMDPLVLVDALVNIMGHEEKELCQVGQLAAVLIIEAASTILTSKERAASLPLIEYLSEKMCSLCYERAWYAKSGGCFGIKTLMERLPLRWVLLHQYQFLKALLFVMMDLTNEVSNGAVDMAKSTLDKLIKLSAVTLSDDTPEEMLEVQKKSLSEVTMELVRQITSPITCVRQQAMASLQVLSDATGRTVTEIMLPHKDLLQDMIPPKEHILKHQPVNAQIGIMEGNTFCTTLQPRLFTLDLNLVEHETFFQELISLCDSEDQVILKNACYKNQQGQLGALRKAALNCLATLHYIDNELHRERVFTVLYKVLNSNDADLQEAAFHCMKKFISGSGIKWETVRNHIRGLLMQLGDYRQLSLNVVRRLSYLTLIFPNTFNEKLCDQLRQLLRRGLELCVQNMRQGRPVITELKQCAAILEIFHQIPVASAALVEPLITVVLTHEKLLFIEAASPFREPLSKFLRVHPERTIEVLVGIVQSQVEPAQAGQAVVTTPSVVHSEQHNRYLEYLLKGERGQVLRRVLLDNPNIVGRLLAVNLSEAGRNVIATSFPAFDMNSVPQVSSQNARYDYEYLGTRLISILIKHEEKTDFLIKNPVLVAMLREVWISPDFQSRHIDNCVEISNYVHWRTPKFIVKALLNYCKQNPNDVELLFQLMRAFTNRYIPDFKFLKDFVDTTVVTQYSVEWKRNAFFKFVKLFEEETNFPQELVAKVLQLIIIPAFSESFEKGEGTELIGGDPAPDQDLEDNVISVFILRIIDNPKVTLDSVRILVLQLACVFVERASAHIHDAANKRQGVKLRRLMTYAWPCLLVRNSVDPATKYHGHLLLAHIIAKFAIHKKIVLQVFHSLLKAHAVEARAVVRQALEMLTPAMPARMEDGNTMLTHWTKKMIVEEGHTLAQLVHMLQLLARHYQVYYPVRHHLIAHMVASVQRLGFTANAQIEHKKLSVDLAEVVIKWEMQRNRDEQELLNASGPQAVAAAVQQTQPTPPSSSQSSGTNGNVNLKPVEKIHADAIVNFLLRMACQVNDSAAGVAAAMAAATAQGGTVAGLPIFGVGNPAGEMLSRRCVALLKTALKADMWPNAELKLAWFDKLLLTVEAVPTPNFQNVCTALDLLTFLLSILRKEAILNSFKHLQRGIAACMNSTNSKVLRSVHSLLSRLMGTFPAEPGGPKYEEVDFLYAQVFKVIADGLSSYEKVIAPNPPQLFGTLMILKAACVNNLCYIDRVITPFMRVLQKMTREHLAPTTEANPMGTELLILSLDLVKNRIGVMGQEMRKIFIGSVLVGLIEKSPEPKVLKAITKMVEDWVRNKGPFAFNQSPGLREKSILLVKMMQHIEKRFPDDLDLNGQFLELINFVFRDEVLQQNVELCQKLEPAFMAGLRCVQPAIRAKFFEVYDASKRRRLYDRLLYIVSNQNWETIGPHFWIKQCIEFVLATAASDRHVETAPGSPLLPSVTSVVAQAAEFNTKSSFSYGVFKTEPIDYSVACDNYLLESSVSTALASEGPGNVGDVSMSEDLPEFDLNISSTAASKPLDASIGQNSASSTGVRTGTSSATTTSGSGTGALGGKCAGRQNIKQLVLRQMKFLEQAGRDVRLEPILLAVSQLCHMDTSLAQYMWVQLFPRLWKVLGEKQQSALSLELTPFVCSGSHVIQKDCHPSALGTFCEALSFCPNVQLRPIIIKYVGKSHNMWHRATLQLEQMSADAASGTKRTSLTMMPSMFSLSPLVYASTASAAFGVDPKLPGSAVDYDMQRAMAVHLTQPSLHQESLDCLSEMYSLLREEDLFAGLWQTRARYPETVTAVVFEQHGMFEEAQLAYEAAMAKAKVEFGDSPAPLSLRPEFRLWEDHWIRCTKELNQWEVLLEYGNGEATQNKPLVLEAAWRIPNWSMMKEALTHVELACPKEFAWRVNLYRGYVAVCHPEDNQLSLIDRIVEMVTSCCIREWRRLPPIVSAMHVGMLQAAQQIMELQEAAQIHQGLSTSVGVAAAGVAVGAPGASGVGGASSGGGGPTSAGGPGGAAAVSAVAALSRASLYDMRAIVKTWRNRLPVLSDDLSHWNDIFTWRQLHYQAIVSHFEANQASAGGGSASDSSSVSGGAGAFGSVGGGGAGSATGAVATQTQTNNAMIGVHASASTIIHFGKIARKHGLTNVCLESLNKIHIIPSVPIIDCYQKIRQQVKCYLHMSGVMTGTSAMLMPATSVSSRSELQEGLDVIESTNLKYFGKDMTAEFYALKGLFLAQLGRSTEANKAFSAAIQMYDLLHKGWALWGEYLETLFIKEPYSERSMQLGEFAVTCYLHAARIQNEGKARKYLARLLWLLTFDNERFQLSERVDQYYNGVPPQLWLPWVPQLLTCLVRQEGKQLLNLLTTVGRVFPQAVYFPIRTLYLTLKVEQRERYKSSGAVGYESLSGRLKAQQQLVQIATSGHQYQSTVASAAAACMPASTTATTATTSASGHHTTSSNGQQLTGASLQGGTTSTGGAGGSSVAGAGGPTQFRATPSMWRCSKIMHIQRDLHPTVLSCLEGIVDQLVWFRENWYEEVLRQLKQALAKCLAVAFEHRMLVNEATVTPHTLNFVKKLVSTFGVGIENVAGGGSGGGGGGGGVASGYSSSASESLARRVQATAQDPVFQKMKLQFTADFDFSTAHAMKLHNLIGKLKKWIKILEAKAKLLPKSTLVEEKCRFMSTFSPHTADVALPGEYLLPKANNYYVRIARFMPRVEVIHKHNAAARRLSIRGQNGRLYPYLVVNDACLSDARREERVLQLLRMFNQLLGRQKETSRRGLNFTVPRVVAVSPQMRLVEDNPRSVSLIDIYKQRCQARQIEYDSPIAKYYEKLASVQSRAAGGSASVGGHQQVLKDILRDIQNSQVPRTFLKEWAQTTYPDPTDYWTFRKQFSMQMALCGLVEFVLHLTRLSPDMVYIHQDSGFVHSAYYKFNVSDASGELEHNRPVPFRLTPNLAELIGPPVVGGVQGGVMCSVLVAVARCFNQPAFSALLRAILRDEMIAWHKKNHESDPAENRPASSAAGATVTPTPAPPPPPTSVAAGASSSSSASLSHATDGPPDMDGEQLVNAVNKAVAAITARLNSLTAYDGSENNKVQALLAAASNPDNLCRMDPAWHPWL